MITTHISITLDEAYAGTTKRISLPDGRRVDLTIPPGIQNGTTYLGEGFTGHSGRVGMTQDLLKRYLAHLNVLGDEGSYPNFEA